MPSPFHNPRAFAPFHCDEVRISGRRASRAFAFPAKVCLLDRGEDDPLVDGTSEVLRRRVSLIVRRNAWRETTPPVIGDIVLDDCGAKFAVCSVRSTSGDWELEAKEA